MKFKAFGALLLLLSAGAAADQIRWAKDWTSAKAAAKAGKKLIMIDFFTEW